jgi:predicted nucleotidyltransferase
MHPGAIRADAFAERLAADLAAILGVELVGVYLHGSLAMGCFNPERSDVDLLVVTREPPAPARRRAIAELMLSTSGNPYPVEMTVLTTGQLRPWRHPAPYDFHYSELWRQPLDQRLRSGGLGSARRTDPDLAAHVTTLRARGRVLLGAPIGEVFPEVPEADFRQAILADLEWTDERSTQVYGVLNACRVLAHLDGQGVLSKAEAADWALRHGNLPADHRSTVAMAASAYRDGGDEPCSPQQVRAFVQWVAARVDVS